MSPPLDPAACAARMEPVRERLQVRLKSRKEALIRLAIQLDGHLPIAPTARRSSREGRGKPSKLLRTAQKTATPPSERARIREEVRQALLRCDRVLSEFDRVVGMLPVNPQAAARQLQDIPDLPEATRQEIRRNLRRWVS